MTHADYGYGLWGLALVNAAVFILFAFSFFKPATKRDWRSFGAFSAFIVALFAEMYGFPLTIFLLVGVAPVVFPRCRLVEPRCWTHPGNDVRLAINPHYGPFHIASFVLIGVGLADLDCMDGASHESAQNRIGPYWGLRPGAAPSIRRVHPRHARFLATMADASDACHVSGAGGDVHSFG
jgi:hypothetical protein